MAAESESDLLRGRPRRRPSRASDSISISNSISNSNSDGDRDGDGDSDDAGSDDSSDMGLTEPSSPTLPPTRRHLRHSQIAGSYFGGADGTRPHGTETQQDPDWEDDSATDASSPPSPSSSSSSSSSNTGCGGAGPELRRVQSFSGLSVSTFTSTCTSASAPSEMEQQQQQQQQQRHDAGEEAAAPSRWMTALGEAQYLAGGLVSHPAECGRHYSVIRHCHALVWYHGPSTSVSITILGSRPLPAHQARSVWLQQKGFSGDVGMAIKALAGTTAGWIDVTPEERAAGPEALPEADERGIQRDLRRFAAKAAGRQRAHTPRETLVVRIPAAAADGYFRLVVCRGPEPGDVLCGSPVFRIASTSVDGSVLRGASLASLPLEVGVKVASSLGQAAVNKYAGAAAHAVVATACGALAAAAPPPAAVNNDDDDDDKAGQRPPDDATVWDAMSQRWIPARDKDGATSGPAGASDIPASLESDTGPRRPFPVDFSARVAAGTGTSTAELGIPTANLVKVSENIKMMTMMGGVFAAWARVTRAKDPQVQQRISHAWHEAIVTIGPLRNAPAEAAMKLKPGLAMHMIHDFAGLHFVGAKVAVRLMGYLHAAAPLSAHVDDLVVELSRDVAATLAILGRDAWQPGGRRRAPLPPPLPAPRAPDFGSRLAGALGRIPLHRAGVRTAAAAERDRSFGRGGLSIARDQ